MSKFTRALAITLLAASVPATIVLAQQAAEPGPDGPAAEERDDQRGPSPEVEARLEDGRIAMAKAALKLTPEQEKLWAPVEEKIRADYAQHRKMREEWRAKREERRTDRADRKKLALPERIERRSERMAEHATKMTERATETKAFAEVVKPFYASLSDEQKEVADHLLSRFAHGGRGPHGGRGGHHRGPRWAMMGPHDGHGGPGHCDRD